MEMMRGNLRGEEAKSSAIETPGEETWLSDDFCPFLKTYSVPVVVIFRFWDNSQDFSQEWSIYSLVYVVPTHNTVYISRVFLSLGLPLLKRINAALE